MFLPYMCLFFFFKQKTAYEMRISDWSSDVCSSDLVEPVLRIGERCAPERHDRVAHVFVDGAAMALDHTSLLTQEGVHQCGQLAGIELFRDGREAAHVRKQQIGRAHV